MMASKRSEYKIDASKLEAMQQWPLESKIIYAQEKIQDWYQHHSGKVCISFSGGKDSTVLLHMIRSIYPDVKAFFVDTGLEYPEIRKFIKECKGVETVRPEKKHKDVIEQYGYPVVSKRVSHMIEVIRNTPGSHTANLYLTGITQHGVKAMAWKLPERWKPLLDAPFKISDKCCYYLKEKALMSVQRKSGLFPYIGIMAKDSTRRREAYLKTGCNNYYGNFGAMVSKPLSIFTDEDIWQYIKDNRLQYSTIYDRGYNNTGCMFCLFGLHRRAGDITKLRKEYPAVYEYMMENLKMREVIEYLVKIVPKIIKRSRL